MVAVVVVQVGNSPCQQRGGAHHATRPPSAACSLYCSGGSAHTAFRAIPALMRTSVSQCTARALRAPAAARRCCCCCCCCGCASGCCCCGCASHRLTKERGFTTSASGVQQVPMMKNTFEPRDGILGAHVEGEYDVVALPYKGGTYSAVALLPARDKSVEHALRLWASGPQVRRLWMWTPMRRRGRRAGCGPAGASPLLCAYEPLRPRRRISLLHASNLGTSPCMLWVSGIGTQAGTAGRLAACLASHRPAAAIPWVYVYTPVTPVTAHCLAGAVAPCAAAAGLLRASRARPSQALSPVGRLMHMYHAYHHV